MKQKYTTHLLLLFFLSMYSFIGSAQTKSLTIDASQVFTIFRFIDSDGVKDKEYTSNVSGAYSLGFLYKFDNIGLIIHPRLGMRKAGATLVYDNSNYMWDMQYADFRLGLGYQFDLGMFNPYIKIAPYAAYLLKANQVLNNENFDLKENGELKTMDFGLVALPGVHATLSDVISAYAEFNYLYGLGNIETSSSGQKGYNKAMAVTLGLAFTITGE